MYSERDYAMPLPAAEATSAERADFIRKTYIHVAGAVGAFAILLAVLVTMVPQQVMINLFAGRAGFLIIFVGFIIASFVSQRMAQADMAPAVQYGGLALYVALEAFI